MTTPGRQGIYGPEFKGGTVEYAAVRFLHALGRVVRLHKLYPADNAYVRGAVEDAFLAYDNLMDFLPGAVMAFSAGRVTVDRSALPRIPEQIEPVLAALDSHGIDELMLLPGGDASHIAGFALLLSLPPGTQAPAQAPFARFDDIAHLSATVSRPPAPAPQAAPAAPPPGPFGPPPDAGPAAPAPAASSPDELLQILLAPPEDVIDRIDSPLDAYAENDPAALGTAAGRAVAMAGPPPADGSVHPAAVRVFEGLFGRMATRSRYSLSRLFEKGIRMVAALDRNAAGLLAPQAALQGPESLASVLVASLRSEHRARAVQHGIEADEELDGFAESYHRATASPEDRLSVLAALSYRLLEQGLAFPEAARHLAGALRLEARATEKDLQLASQGRTEDFFTQRDSGPRPVILVAHSRGDTVQQLAETAKKMGLEAVAYQNGRTALQGFLEKQPRLAVLDLGLPGLHGIDIIQHLKVRNQTVPLVILSDHPELANDFEVKTYPSFVFLPPRWKVEDVAAAVKDLAARHGVRMATTVRTRALPGRILKTKKYLSALPGGTPLAPGFDVGSFALPLGKAGFEIVDFVPGRAGCTAVLLVGQPDHTDGRVVRARLLQAAVWMVAPWLEGPREILLQASALLGETQFGRGTLSALLALLDPRTQSATVASAGYPQALIYRLGAPDIHALSASPGPLSVRPEGAAPSVTGDRVDLDSQALLLLLSPGLLSASNAEGETFGWEPLKGLLFTAASLAPKDILASLEREVVRHAGAEAPESDPASVAVTGQI